MIYSITNKGFKTAPIQSAGRFVASLIYLEFTKRIFSKFKRKFKKGDKDAP